MHWIMVVCLIGFFSVNIVNGYEIPEPQFEAYQLGGFKVTIITDKDYSSATVHVNFNEPFVGLNSSGHFNCKMRLNSCFKRKWQCGNYTTQLQLGDKVYYLIRNVKYGVEYLLGGGEAHYWTVSELTYEMVC